jgi:hypothetical protein
MRKLSYLFAAATVGLTLWSGPGLTDPLSSGISSVRETSLGLIQKANSQLDCTPWSEHGNSNCNYYQDYSYEAYRDDSYPGYGYGGYPGYGLGIPFFFGFNFDDDDHHGRRHHRRHHRHHKGNW